MSPQVKQTVLFVACGVALVAVVAWLSLLLFWSNADISL